MTTSSFAEAFGSSVQPTKCLFITPNDEDTMVGAGMLLQACVQSDMKVRILVACDGSQRYSDTTNQKDIGEIKRKEAVLSYFSLGVKDVEFLNYPDLNLQFFTGRAEAVEDDMFVIKDYCGLQNTFTFFIREFQPDIVFVGNSLDSYPDHAIVSREAQSSVANASADIWPELGSPLATTPSIVEFPIARPLGLPPNVMLEGNNSAKKKKVEALKYFKSQIQLEKRIRSITEQPPEEFFRVLENRYLDPAQYRDIF